MDEASSYVRLDLLSQDGKAAPNMFRLVLESHDGRALLQFRREARARERHRHCDEDGLKALDAVDGAHSAASIVPRVVALKRTTMRGAVHGRG